VTSHGSVSSWIWEVILEGLSSLESDSFGKDVSSNFSAVNSTWSLISGHSITPVLGNMGSSSIGVAVIVSNRAGSSFSGPFITDRSNSPCVAVSISPFVSVAVDLEEIGGIRVRSSISVNARSGSPCNGSSSGIGSFEPDR